MEKGDALVAENKFIVMARHGIDMLSTISRSPILRNNDDGRFHLIDKGLAMEISSTYIREEFAMGESRDTSCLLLVTTILKSIIFIKNSGIIF